MIQRIQFRSERFLSVLCVSAVQRVLAVVHPRDAENAETTQRSCALLSVLSVGIFAMLLFAAPKQVAGQRVVDKMVATVNAGVKTELITYSDLLWQLALQPDTPLDNPSSEQLNGALRLLIDQRLILQEAEKLPTIVPTSAEIAGAR